MRFRTVRRFPPLLLEAHVHCDAFDIIITNHYMFG